MKLRLPLALAALLLTCYLPSASAAIASQGTLLYWLGTIDTVNSDSGASPWSLSSGGSSITEAAANVLKNTQGNIMVFDANSNGEGRTNKLVMANYNDLGIGGIKALVDGYALGANFDNRQMQINAPGASLPAEFLINGDFVLGEGKSWKNIILNVNLNINTTVAAQKTLTIKGGLAGTADKVITIDKTKVVVNASTNRDQYWLGTVNVNNGAELVLAANGGSHGVIGGTVIVNAGSKLTLATRDATGYGGTVINRIDLNKGELAIAQLTDADNQTFTNMTINMTGGTISGKSFDLFSTGGASPSTVINVLESDKTSVISSQVIARQDAGAVFNVADGAAVADLLISGVISNSSYGSKPVTKKGAGVMVLTGANNYTGQTIIEGGTVQVGDGGASGQLGTGNIILSDNVTLAFKRTGTLDISGAISNAVTSTGTNISVRYDNNGDGLYNVKGINTYSGKTYINEARVKMGNTKAFGTSSLVLDGGTIILANGVSTLNIDHITAKNATLDFSGNTGAVVNATWNGLDDGSILYLQGYDPANSGNALSVTGGFALGVGAWEELDNIKMSDGRSTMASFSGMILEFEADPGSGELKLYGNQDYQYTSTIRYIGSMAGDGSGPVPSDSYLTLTGTLSFGTGAAAVYGFTTGDVGANKAYSFTVNSQLKNGKVPTGVVIKSQAGNTDRVVTLGNTANSFSQNLFVQTSAIARSMANVDDASIFNPNNVTILGTNNTVIIATEGIMQLATGAGSLTRPAGETYTYANNFELRNNSTLEMMGDVKTYPYDAVAKDSGSHTLTGVITLSGDVNKKREIKNSSTGNTLTLSNRIIGPLTLTLTTDANVDSRIILDLNKTAGRESSVGALDINGHIELTGGLLTAVNGVSLTANGTLKIENATLGAGGVISAAAPVSIVMNSGATLKAAGNLLSSDGIDYNLAGLDAVDKTVSFDSNGYKIDLNGHLAGATGGTLVFTDSSAAHNGTIELKNALATGGAVAVNGGTLKAMEGLDAASVNVGKNGTLEMIFAKPFTTDTLTVEGTLSGTGSLTGHTAGTKPAVSFINGGSYNASMSGQTWSATFSKGSTLSNYLQTSGNVIFDSGSNIVINTNLDGATPPSPIQAPVLSLTGDGNAILNPGLTVTGGTSNPSALWEQGASHTFNVISLENGTLKAADNTIINAGNVGNYVTTGGWGTFLNGVIGADANGKNLTVTVTRNEIDTADFAKTGNQLEIAKGVDYAINHYNSLGLSGTKLGDIIGYLNSLEGSIGALAPDTLEMVGGLSNYQNMAGQRTDLLRHLETTRQRAHAGKGMVGTSTIPDNAFWVEGTQSYSTVDGDDEAMGYKMSTWGGALGADYLSGEHFSLGAAFAYSNITVDSDKYNAQSKGDAYYIDLYGRWENGPWNGVVVLTGGKTDFDSSRRVSLGENYGGDTTVNGSTKGTSFLGMAEVAYDINVNENALYLQPYLGMALGNTKQDGYRETGFGNAGLDVASDSMRIMQGRIGARLFKRNIDKYFEYETSRWEVRAGLIQEFGDTDYKTTSNFIGVPMESFVTKGREIGSTTFTVGAGGTYSFDKSWSGFADVNGEFRNGETGMNSSLGLRCTF